MLNWGQSSFSRKKMKKTIIIICLIITVFGVFISSLPVLLKLSGYDIPLKNYLLDKIFAEQGHQLDLQNLEIGLGSFEISKISFLSSDERIEVLIDEIVIDFNLYSFFKNPASPELAIQEIFLNQPRLIIHNTKKDREQNPKDSTQINILSQLQVINNLNNIRLSNGKIIIESNDGNFTAYAQNLDGWFNSANRDNIVLKVQGNAFSTEEENFVLNLKFAKKSMDFTSNIQILEYNFNESTLNQFTDKLFVEGVAFGNLDIKGNVAALDSIKINGNITLKDMAATFNEEQINNVNFKLSIKENRMIMQEGVLDYKAHPVKISAEISNLFKPELVGTFETHDFHLKTFEKFFPENIFSKSAINLKIGFRYSDGTYKVNGNVESNNLTVYNQRFEKMHARFALSDEGVNIPLISITDSAVSVSGNGNYDYASHNLGVNINGAYKSGKHVLFDKLSDANHTFALNLNVNMDSGISSGKWLYNLAGYDTLLSVDGAVNGTSESIRVSLLQSNHKKLKGEIVVSNYLKTPNIKYAFFENFPFSIFTSDKIITSLFDKIETKGVLTGSVNDLHGKIQVRDKATQDTVLTMATNLKNVLDFHKSMTGKIIFENLTGSYDADFTENFFGGRIEFNEGIKGHLFVDLEKEEEQLQGELSIDAFKLIKAFSDIGADNDYRYQAEINGNVQIGGSLKSPWLKAHFFGDKFVFNEIGYYQPEIAFSVDRTKVVADSIKIYHNNIEWLNGNLEWGLLNNQISGYFNGTGLDVPAIIKSTGLADSLLTGIAEYAFKVQGSISQPHIEAELTVKNGAMDGIKFDKFELSLIDKIPADGQVLNYSDHKIGLQRFSIERQGYYHFNSVGNFPLNSYDEVDLFVNFDGDILGLLPHWEPFFLDGASLSDISLKFKGTSDEIKLVAADIDIDRGELWMNSVAPYVHDISGRITLEEGSDQVNIINLNAFVEDNFLNINTVRDIKTESGRVIEPWYFRGLNLDFGVLALETSNDGVNLNIPGIMEPDVYGKIDLSGKVKGEKFFFAGPLKHPLGYGVVTLNSATITYPFIESKTPSDEPSTAVEFLSNMEWDATVKAGEDVVYRRDIPAYIDNVLTEITVDEKSEGLAFTGIIDQGTFKPVGSLVSTRGRLEYLDLNFKVDRFGLELSKYKDLPNISGKAWTTIRDSVGALPKTIYLQLYTIDSKTGQIKQSGDWQEFKFKLVSADPTIGETQEQVLAYLGYSVDNFKEKATNVGGALTEKYFIRPLLRPIEKVLEKSLGMDLVRFNSSIARNLFLSSVGRQINSQSANPFINPLSGEVPYLYLMSSSEVTVGKYINEDLYLTYTGQLVSLYEDAQSGFDFNHSLGLEYRFFQNMLVEF